ncbi:heat shock 70 kDa protein 16-like [Dioscorea cayenensis subsp. rotundata]|uniref:Heat shock 70 kDa protein 16-like n=1 Tax=Dioscorea cayennensis subsp. rotundata TaxID=55577 RepID=A0AB40BTM8_DIOCR|nr:heat shock 70 kDa protein 16-like [Dioscorea cayenensis subsp. rotundata]
MSVVGFDIGNDRCVIAAVRQRGIDVILNDESKRETPSTISFSDKQRLIGSSSSPLLHPRSTFSQIKHLLLSQPQHRSRLPFLDRDLSIAPVHLLAMLLSHLKLIAERSLDGPVSDCVISIPSYASDLSRRSYLDAARIAGLKPLRLMHDTTATALGYGIYKSDFPSSPTHVVILDIGHCDTQASVVAFEPGAMRVLSHASDPNLGGRDFDEVLFRHFAEQFKDQYKIDVYSNAKACIRLRTACEKLKKVLSANAEAPLSIECLMDEKDVRGFIKREEFEKLAAGLLERVLVPCKKALEDAELGVDSVHSVELVGSGSRIPAIGRILSGFFGKEPSRMLNASECVARGCALQCAMLSPVFRVRNYEVQDCFPYSIGFASDQGPISTLSSHVLFRKGHPFPSVKVLTFLRSSAFHLEAFYADENELPPSAPPKISSFMIGPFQASHGDKSKVKVRFRINLHGIITIDSASLIEDETINPISRSKSDDAEPENADENGSSEKSESDIDRTRKGSPSRRLELPITETVNGGMSQEELSEAQELEKQLSYQDKLIERTKDAKNALESYVYEVRNKLFESYRSYATESEREEISRSLQQTEEWLYDDGDDETESVYVNKLQELKKLVDPVESRYQNEEARAQASRELLRCIADHRKAAESCPTYERDAVISECRKAEQWLREKTQQQESLPKNVDPVLWSHEIKKIRESLDKSCGHILKHNGSPPGAENSKAKDRSNSSDDMQTD